jgi:signal peptidase I
MGDILVSDPSGVPGGRRRGAARATVEFLVVLAASICLARVFVAEAYIVPTGSMAPTLLGEHRDVICPRCGLRFAVGLDDNGPPDGLVCPNCGLDDLRSAQASDSAGDRLLVQKHLFSLRPPRRWEAAVFYLDEAPGQAFVKRIVGLPGESVSLRGGDVYIDGRIARKSLAEQRAMRILVYDHEHRPIDHDQHPRWMIRLGRALDAGGWHTEGSAFVHGTDADDPEPGTDWLEYRHWQPERSAAGPVRDFVAYNGVGWGGDYRVPDLMLEADVAVGSDCRALRVRIDYGATRLMVTIPTDGSGPVSVQRDRETVTVSPTGIVLRASTGNSPRFTRLEATVFDRRLMIALDGSLLFEPHDFEADPDGGRTTTGRLALGLVGGTGTVRGLKVFRDVFYTPALAGSMRSKGSEGAQWRLGSGEYFVLGDNSPVSNDSRFWASGPVVRAESLVGKPFLVHLPSQAVPLKVFGHTLSWIPDPREIRYIR